MRYNKILRIILTILIFTLISSQIIAQQNENRFKYAICNINKTNTTTNITITCIVDVPTTCHVAYINLTKTNNRTNNNNYKINITVKKEFLAKWCKKDRWVDIVFGNTFNISNTTNITIINPYTIEKYNEANKTNEIKNINNIINKNKTNNRQIYKIETREKRKLFGIFPITIKTTKIIDQNSNIIKEERPWWYRLTKK